jgi:hypothetical protein
LEPHLETKCAIAFITSAVRVPPEWDSPLLASDELDPPRDTKKTRAPRPSAASAHDWEIRTYTNLAEHFGASLPGQLVSLGDFAGGMEKSFAKVRDAAPHGLLEKREPSGMLGPCSLQWLDSPYFPLPQPPVEPSTVVSFLAPGGPDMPPWREYVFMTDGMAGSTASEYASMAYDEQAAIYDILGLLAQRRSLISATAQRRLCKIVLPWGRCRFVLTDEATSRPYLIVPVITLLGRRATTLFRRTFTLSLFLVPDTSSSAPPLESVDLAAICQQAAWSATSPRRPMLFDQNGTAPPFEGPLEELVPRGHLHIIELFDAILAQMVQLLGVELTAERTNSIRTLIAISRKHSVIFGSGLHVDGEHSSEIWNELTKRENRGLAEQLGKLLSVNAARRGREWLVGSDGLRLEKMRVTNPYEEDVSTIVLYNPMSRFMVNIMPKSHDLFPTASVMLGVSWLNLLAGTLSSIKEILRSYSYEIDEYRNRIERLGAAEDPGSLLKEIHKGTLTILEEIDVVYSFDLVTPTYRAAHARILDMEGVSEERTNLMRELEIMTTLLRSEETDQLNRKIARSTSSTDNLTLFVVVFSALSAMLVADGLIEIYYHLPVGSTGEYYWSTIVDCIIGAFALGGLLIHRARAPRS